jgi:glucuronoarabinoxylan endo-1,4-beta-xylanase
MNLIRNLLVASAGLFGASILVPGCSDPEGPSTGTQTNWLRTCESDTQCGAGNQCVCNTCTREVSNDESVCDELPGASRVESNHPGAIALCGGEQTTAEALCLALCDEAACPDGSSCVAGVCSPVRESSLNVTIDTTARHQTLHGFGATIAYIENEITEHPDKSALYDAMFVDSGFEVLRLRNLFEEGGDNDFSATTEIVDEATTRMSTPPTIFLMSASPPASLKQNGSTYCDGNPESCTLTRGADGGFDYAGMAQHLRSSLESYATAGIIPEFFSIQNDPNYVPPSGRAIETCHFLPREGTETISVDGADVEMEYPGYTEALSAFVEAVADLPSRPKLAGPEATSVGSSAEYAEGMDLTNLDAIAHHMYGNDPFDPDVEGVTALSAFADDPDRPLLQTEMGDDGLRTALLIQQGLLDVGTSMYLQTSFIAPAFLPSPDTGALIALTETGFELQDPYYALRHFAYETERGWTRVEAEGDLPDGVRVSAWISPDETRLTVILVNPSQFEEVVSLGMDNEFGDGSVTRTVFPGSERFADLGDLSAGNTFVLPGEAIVTLSFGL